MQCQAYREQYGMRAVYLIPVNLYGPRDNFEPRSSHVIPALVRKFLEANASGAREVVCWGDGSATREFLYVADAAEAIVTAAECYEEAAPVNIGSGQEISVRDLAGLIARLCGFTRPACLGRLQAQRPAAAAAGDLPRRGGLRFPRPRTPLEEGLKTTIEWYTKSRHDAMAAARPE